jgi:hypothetical protein
MKLEIKHKVISDTVEFRHAYLQIPAVLAEDEIINGLQVMAGALRNAPPLTSSNQLDAIEALRTLFEKWWLLAPPLLLNEGHALHLTCASLNPTRCSLLNTAPAPDRTNNSFHALEQNNSNNDAPSTTTWLPLHGCHLCYWHLCHVPQSNAHLSPLSIRPRPRGSSLTTLLPHAQKNPTAASNAATSKGVQVTKTYCPSKKVMSGTTATQFPHGTDAIPYS